MNRRSFFTTLKELVTEFYNEGNEHAGNTGGWLTYSYNNGGATKAGAYLEVTTTGAIYSAGVLYTSNFISFANISRLFVELYDAVVEPAGCSFAVGVSPTYDPGESFGTDAIYLCDNGDTGIQEIDVSAITGTRRILVRSYQSAAGDAGQLRVKRIWGVK